MHCRNVLFDNVQFENIDGGRHAIELAACYNFTVQNCYFYGTYNYNDTSCECVNIDPCIYGAQPYVAESSAMYDHTRNNNIFIRNNSFYDGDVEGVRYTNGVGSHGLDGENAIAKNVVIENNDFGKPYYSAIDIGSWVDTVIRNNFLQSEGTEAFILRKGLIRNLIVADNIVTGVAKFFKEGGTILSNDGIILPHP